MIKYSIVLCLLISIPPVYAEDEYELTWHSLTDGGQVSDGDYVLHFTIDDLDSVTDDDGNFTLENHFWPSCFPCIVNMQDLANFLVYWLNEAPGSPADLNEDGVVDLIDYGILAGYWLSHCPFDWSL